jgi:hypothetical protein
MDLIHMTMGRFVVGCRAPWRPNSYVVGDV